MEKLLLRPDEAASLLGVSRSKIYALISAGLIPSVRLGSAVRVPAERLREWLAAESEPGARERDTRSDR